MIHNIDKFIGKAEFELPVKVLAFAKIGSSTIVGWNSDKTSPRYVREYETGHVLYTRHAELHILDQIPFSVDPTRIKIYVLRLDGTGKISMAKPCKFCQNSLKERGVLPKNVWYTDWDGKWKKLIDWSTQLKELFPRQAQ